MNGALGRLCAFAGAATIACALVTMQAAAADVVTPPGSCLGGGTWQKARFTELSPTHSPSDVIKIPQADTVRWAGSVKGFKLGSIGTRRKIDGAVQLELPIGTVNIDTWGKTSVRYANTGEHKYDLPSVLIGVKMKVKGFHKDNGKLTCSGSVYMKVEGSAFKNPLAWVALGGLVIFGGLLLFAGRPVFKKLSAFEDANPG
jgi:hypothetical protein